MQTIHTGDMPWEAVEVDRWLREGNSTLGWRGDPRLDLRVGVITATRAGFEPKVHRWVNQGEEIGRSWVVYRHNEDGTETPVCQANIHSVHEIIPKLIGMDPRTPGFEPVMDKVERQDAQTHKENSRKIQEAIGMQREHLWHLVADRQNGKTTFRGMPGSNPDKQL